jgi:hypothetical protein
VETKSDFGRIPAQIPVDENLGTRLYCEDCWIWLLEDETVCPVCGKNSSLRLRERNVSGWLGIQRYFDQGDYGIDLIRNGRVIEERSKVFFQWTNPDTDESLLEYPLEQTHWGGRIIGELSVDFVPLASHQKDSFDKTSREWKLVEHVVRGTGPIIQKYRQQTGFQDRNLSPLARLHTGYRRGQPAGLRNLVPGDEKGRGFNRPAAHWAALFAEGDPDYQNDDKWYQAVLIAEEANSKSKGANIPTDLTGGETFPSDEEQPAETASGAPVDLKEPIQQEQRRTDPVLSGVFELPEVPGAPKLEVTSEQLIVGALPQGRAIRFAAVGQRAEFCYDQRHRAFSRSLLEPVDCLIQELAYQFLQRSSATQSEFPLSELTARIRERYFPWSIQTFDQAREEAIAVLDELVEYFTEALSPLTPLELDVVTSHEREIISEVVMRVEHAGSERVDQVIRNGEYPKFLGPRYLPQLVEKWPELVFDGHFLTVAYADVDPKLRTQVLHQVLTPINDLLWIANPDAPQGGGSEWRHMLGRAVSSLRLITGWRSP